MGDKFPPNLMVPLSLKSSLRYSENPHQKAAFYVDKSLSKVNASGIATAIQYHGKEMSYNNYLDVDAAWNCVLEFRSPTYVIGNMVHSSPVRPLIEMLHPTDVQIKEMAAFALWRLTQDIYKQADNEDNISDFIRVGGVQRLQDKEFIVQTTKDQCSKFLQLGVGFDDDYVQVLQSERPGSAELLASSLDKAWLSFHMKKGSIVEGTRKWWSYEAVVIILAQSCGVNVIRIMTVLQGKHANGKNAWFGKDGNWQLFFCVVVGILDGLVIDRVAEYHTSKAYNLIQEVVDPYQARVTTTRLTIDVDGPFGDNVGSAIMKNHYVFIGASWITSTFNKVWRVSLHKDECEDAEHIDVGNQPKGWSHAINFPDLALVSIDGAVVLLKGLQVLSNINLGFTATASVIAPGGSEVILGGQDSKLQIHSLSQVILLQKKQPLKSIEVQLE